MAGNMLDINKLFIFIDPKFFHCSEEIPGGVEVITQAMSQDDF